MHRVGIRLSALLLLGFVAIYAQCLAYCALGICPQTAPATAHPHCPHHPQNSKMPAHGAAHDCVSQESFLPRSSAEIAGLHDFGIAVAPAGTFPAPGAAPLQPGMEAGPAPPAAPPPSLFVLRI